MPANTTCVGCGCEIVRGTGFRYSRCAPCTTSYRKLYNERGRPLNDCIGCGGPIPKHHSKFCSLACRQPPTGATSTCMICGDTYRRVRGGGCCSPECTAEARRERYWRKNRRRRFKTTPGAYTVREITERDGFRCHLCGRKVDMERSGMAKWGPTIDHLVPFAAGGDDTAENVALAHRHCNVSRQDQGAAQLRLMG